ncbi:alcohol dehydrogenase catalytic domain-containing protein [Lentzea sp. NPDC058450]|uniref:alcohol dehydrogenase catalytic domain-containing protein n=1 Tax=Lentzea sp. NPDC058450 TaxID=3346505 RepID=UPI0036557CFF
MKAVTWHGKRDVRVEEVPDPRILQPTDAVVRVTSTGVCGSDLHLYEVLGPFMTEGDVLGHEPMGVVEEVGAEVTRLKPGDRVVVPFNISCGSCFMCDRGLQSQCETTQVTAQGKGAALLGYTKLYGQVPGGQAEYLRVPRAQYGPVKVPDGPPDDRFVYLSDVLPTAWQAVEYAEIPPGGSVAVFGLGPVGQMAARVARHGATAVRFAHNLVSALPRQAGALLTEKAGIDRLSVLYAAIDSVRRGGTISLSGVYGGMIDPIPMMELFDKQIRLHMGQANVRRWVDDILPLLSGTDDPLGVDDFATHRLPLDEAPRAYEMFQKKLYGAQKVLLLPTI